MHLRNGQLFVSPTDLAYFLSCRHRTALELSVAHGVRARPQWDDPLLEALFAMGLAHEREYVGALRERSRTVVDLSEVKDRNVAIDRTLAAMRDGADVVVQAALARGRWYGRPDILMKVDRPSPKLGAWSYEAADTKLARETRGGTILQLGVYCEMLEEAQGAAPERFHVVTPADRSAGPSGEPTQVVRSYRFHDYAAYLRLLEARLEASVARDHDELAAAHYPEPVDHCDICPWIFGCRDRRRDDDHVSLVAGISRLQRRELEPRGIRTVEALARVGDPMPFTPERGAVETYERVRDQARVQVRSRVEGRVVYELIPLPPSPGASAAPGVKPSEPVGLARLPEPSPGDVFLDLEGDALAADGGREYLFGLVVVGEAGHAEYRRWWAEDARAERRAFEEVVDLIGRRRDEHPGMHVYHYAPYEPSAFKRLMGRYATREREIDELLRGRRFVDLYAVVRQGIRAGVERYSIKNIEPLYGFAREVDLREASRALRIMEQALELERLDAVTDDVRRVVEGYNRDDCVSTLRLRDWLEARRAELIAQGTPIDRPPLVPGEASEKLDERARAVEDLRQRLLALSTTHDAQGTGHAAPSTEHRHGALSTEHGAREEASPEFTLAYLLDWHRREDKAGWWEYYRLCELPEEDLLEEPAAVAGLEFAGELEKIKKSVVQRYSYPEQEVEIHRGDTLKTQDGKVFGELVALRRAERAIDVLVGPSKRDARPTALFAHDHVNARVIEDALFALGERVVAAGRVALLPPGPERALLLREMPRLVSAPFSLPPRPADPGSPKPSAKAADYAVATVTGLDRTTLAIQGPPGSGKTYTGARMICELVRAGRKVGVTATSHKVIVNLLEAVADRARDLGLRVRLGRKGGRDDEGDDPVEPGAGAPADTIRLFSDNDAPLSALVAGDVDVLGGTAWLWAQPKYAGSVDVLFVDEAGQMSLANVLGVTRAATSLVLLGDPQQLEQPSKGVHPQGVGVSALQHVLDGAETMPEGRGLFLPITWRLAPSICAFTSELFYAGQLASKPGLERQALAGTGRFDGSGLWLVEVEHDGNRNGSDEEAAEVARIVRRLLAPGSTWIDEDGQPHAMRPADIRVVAPFNAHVARIDEALARLEGQRAEGKGQDVPVGTVDKFQGQEAPVVIYSMATSRPEDAPRGLEFLYSLNRLNVATSRARCAAIVVASPRLFEPECRTPRQMRLANALCRYRELARVVG